MQSPILSQVKGVYSQYELSQIQAADHSLGALWIETTQLHDGKIHPQVLENEITKKRKQISKSYHNFRHHCASSSAHNRNHVARRIWEKGEIRVMFYPY